MNVIIFAGGSGRRLWPISLKSSPKQFEPIIGEKSTLQLAVERVLDLYGPQRIFISTNIQYAGIIERQIPYLPHKHIIGEPARRDLAAAVGLALLHMTHAADPHEPVGILWGDNYMDGVPRFQQVLRSAEQLVRSGAARIVFVGETPRFANDNLGWIGIGEQLGRVEEQPFFAFRSLTYRPPLEQCRQMFAARSHVWNTGYFITTPAFVLERYREYQPALYAELLRLGATIGTAEYDAVLHAVYPRLPVLSFDDAVLQYLDPQDAVVLHAEMGWSDPGTLYALKEAVNPNPAENVTHGLTVPYQTRDSLLYNYEPNKLLVGVGLDGMVVVNTDRAILVVHKDQIPLVKQLVDSLVGSHLESYT